MPLQTDKHEIRARLRRDPAWSGIYEGTALVAAAGTHILTREEGAAAVGNVYTRRDRRGQGLGRLVTQAVLAELAGVATIGLNVRPTTSRRCISTSGWLWAGTLRPVAELDGAGNLVSRFVLGRGSTSRITWSATARPTG